MHEPSAKVQDLSRRTADFMGEYVYPNERRFYDEAEKLGPWAVYPIVEELMPKVRTAVSRPSSSIAMRRTRATWKCWNATAPTWLKPLLAGVIRSCFAMTEPKVASSDATNN